MVCWNAVSASGCNWLLCLSRLFFFLQTSPAAIMFFTLGKWRICLLLHYATFYLFISFAGILQFNSQVKMTGQIPASPGAQAPPTQVLPALRTSYILRGSRAGSMTISSFSYSVGSHTTVGWGWIAFHILLDTPLTHHQLGLGSHHMYTTKSNRSWLSLANFGIKILLHRHDLPL